MSANRPPDELLARVLSEEGTPAERAAVEAWGSSSAAASAELAQLRRAWGTGSGAAGAWDVDRAWARVAPQLEEQAPPPPDIAPRPDIAPATGGQGTSGWQIAAAAVLVIGAVWGWRAMSPAPGVEIVHATADGERKSIALTDGSTVVLAPRSRLVVSAGFGRDTRELTLQGEGWFSVVHDDARPFTVSAGAFRVRDIGTVFTVRTHGGDTVGVSVVEGSVAVRRAVDDPTNETVLMLGDIGRFIARGAGAVVDRGQPVAALASWTEGDLELLDVSAAEAVAALSRWYGTPVRIDDPIVAARLVTITLSLDSLDQALEDLALLLDRSIERVEDGFILR
jgi:transmembrane sensor